MAKKYLKEVFEELKTDCIDVYDDQDGDLAVAFVIDALPDVDDVDNIAYNYVLNWLSEGLEVVESGSSKHFGNYARVKASSFVSKHFKMLSKLFDYGKSGMVSRVLPSLISGGVSDQRYVELMELIKGSK
jgi:hypothetical protein